MSFQRNNREFSTADERFRRRSREIVASREGV
jgi:hypothetical protein